MSCLDRAYGVMIVHKPPPLIQISWHERFLSEHRNKCSTRRQVLCCRLNFANKRVRRKFRESRRSVQLPSAWASEPAKSLRLDNEATRTFSQTSATFGRNLRANCDTNEYVLGEGLRYCCCLVATDISSYADYIDTVGLSFFHWSQIGLVRSTINQSSAHCHYVSTISFPFTLFVIGLRTIG